MSWLLNPNESKRIQHQSFKSKKWIYPASFTTVNPQLKWFQVVPQLVIPLKAALNTRDLALGKYGKSWGSHARRECCSPMWTRHSLEKSSEKIGIQLQVVWCLTFLYQKGKGSTCWLIQRTETTTMLELIAHWSSFTIGYGCSYHRSWVYHLSDLSDIQSVLQQVIHRSCAPPWSSCRSWSSVAILGGTLRTGQEGSLKRRTKGIWAGCWLM